MTVADPTLEYETGLHAEGARYVIGCDEVGRGALAGPVAVGICVVDAEIGAHPAGLRDSKMLSEKRREEMAPLASGWARHSAVGLATAAEIDEFGIMVALGMAGQRALAQVVGFETLVYDSILLLDGSYNWLTPVFGPTLAVRTRVKADRDCASVAAASVVAKVHRDRMMIDYDPQYPGYGWVGNKGYASPTHMAAIQTLGPSALHRLTWLHDRTQPEPLFEAPVVE